MKIKRTLKWLLGLILLLLVGWIVVAYLSSTNDCQRYSAVPAHAMKAFIKCEYGTPDVLRLVEMEKPVPDDNQLLVKVRAVSVNAVDGHMLRGNIIIRLTEGLRKPKETRTGVDYAGVVEAVGKNVTQFKPGDEVFGGKTGAFAEYLCVLADRAVALKPAKITFEQAAAVPVAAVTALQGLRDNGRVQAGQKVLINGASGGVGTFAVQIAKSYGAEVTAVCSARNADLARSLGADHVIDYTKEDFTKRPERYDLIYDNVGNHSFSERRRVLKPGGICVLAGIGGAGAREGMFARIVGSLSANVFSRFVREKFPMFVAALNQRDLNVLRDLMLSGKVTPVVERTYPFTQIRDALEYLEQGHARGKIVVTVP